MTFFCGEIFFVLAWVTDTGEKWKFQNVIVEVNKQPFKNLVLSNEFMKVCSLLFSCAVRIARK